MLSTTAKKCPIFRDYYEYDLENHKHISDIVGEYISNGANAYVFTHKFDPTKVIKLSENETDTKMIKSIKEKHNWAPLVNIFHEEKINDRLFVSIREKLETDFCIDEEDEEDFYKIEVNYYQIENWYYEPEFETRIQELKDTGRWNYISKSSPFYKMYKLLYLRFRFADVHIINGEPHNFGINENGDYIIYDY